MASIFTALARRPHVETEQNILKSQARNSLGCKDLLCKHKCTSLLEWKGRRKGSRD